MPVFSVHDLTEWATAHFLGPFPDTYHFLKNYRYDSLIYVTLAFTAMENQFFGEFLSATYRINHKGEIKIS
jgi:hypothetical protein